MFTTRQEIQGTFGVVSSTHWLASATGMAMLEKGGTAFDAAVAAGFCFQVVDPHLNGPGGDVPILVYEATARTVSVICGQGPAPAAATIGRFRDLGVDLIPGIGLLPAVVPGAFDGWMRLLRDYGTLKLRDVLEPAIGYARDGYPVTPGLHEALAGVTALFNSSWTSSAATYLEDGKVPRVGALARNVQLAETYERILRQAEAAGSDRQRQIESARDAFYRGFVAAEIDSFSRSTEVVDSTGRAFRGLLSADDMASWESTTEDPVTFDYRNYTVCKTGPWGQGPLFLQSLALLKGFDLDAMDPAGADFVHTVVECTKLAFADREAYYGDPNFVTVPLDALLSEDYNSDRRSLVESYASLELRPGTVEGHPARLPARVGHLAGRSRIRDAAGVGEPTVAVDWGDTVNLNVIDRHGNMVAAMPSGGWLQSSPIVPALGFCLGTRAQMFWLEDGLAGSLAPGKRPRTTLTPGLALRDGEAYMAFGSPGGDGQDQWALQLFLRHVHYGLSLQEAIEVPAFLSMHHPNSFYPREANPGHLNVEGSFGQAAIAALKGRGHRVEVWPELSLGRLCAVSRDDGMLKAAATPRGMQAYACGR